MKLLRPGTRITYVFAEDRDLPKDKQPRLIGRVLSADAQYELMQAVRDTTTPLKERQLAAVMIGVSGWENVNHPETGEPIPFSAEAVTQWMDIAEINELVEMIANSGRLSVDERKKSESPHSSDVANSVQVAPVPVAV